MSAGAQGLRPLANANRPRRLAFWLDRGLPSFERDPVDLPALRWLALLWLQLAMLGRLQVTVDRLKGELHPPAEQRTGYQLAEALLQLSSRRGLPV